MSHQTETKTDEFPILTPISLDLQSYEVIVSSRRQVTTTYYGAEQKIKNAVFDRKNNGVPMFVFGKSISNLDASRMVYTYRGYGNKEDCGEGGHAKIYSIKKISQLPVLGEREEFAAREGKWENKITKKTTSSSQQIKNNTIKKAFLSEVQLAYDIGLKKKFNLRGKIHALGPVIYDAWIIAIYVPRISEYDLSTYCVMELFDKNLSHFIFNSPSDVDVEQYEKKLFKKYMDLAEKFSIVCADVKPTNVVVKYSTKKNKKNSTKIIARLKLIDFEIDWCFQAVDQKNEDTKRLFGYIMNLLCALNISHPLDRDKNVIMRRNIPAKELFRKAFNTDQKVFLKAVSSLLYTNLPFENHQDDVIKKHVFRFVLGDYTFLNPMDMIPWLKEHLDINFNITVDPRLTIIEKKNIEKNNKHNIREEKRIM